jgi:leucyl-tRNA synthetase
MSKCEFQVRYQKQIGKNVLFPFAFHCTGMPIHAAARRLRREIEQGKTQREQGQGPTQFEILKQIGISETEIPKFQDPKYWLEFFPPQGQQDLKEFGVFVDWRRSFITTEVNPFYDSFIRWQFNTLKAAEKVKFGKRYTIYSQLDGQPCADHDRSKGEGVGPQEYTLIKIQCLDLPESLKDQFHGKKVFLVAATLRPETMYGQTNCYVLAEGEYGVFEMKNDEFFVCAHRAARNLAFQEMTKEFGKYPCLANVKGQDLIGLPLKAPLTSYEVVYALPM